MKSRKGNDEKEIIQLLQQMPRLEDRQEKYQIYKQSALEDNMTDLASHDRSKFSRFAPVLATAAAIFIIVLIPFVYNLSDSHFTSEVANDSSGAMEAQDEQLTMIEDENYDALFTAEADKSHAYVLHTVNDDENVIFGAIPDEQGQYLIPITFVVSAKGNLDELYNKLPEYMEEHELADNDFLLQGATYSIDDEKKIVKVQLPQDFSLGEGSVRAYQFEKTLSVMFAPHGITKAVFETADGNTIDLGPFGKMEEMPILPEERASYKLYKERYLVPVPQQPDFPIDEAILEMKEEDTAFHLTNTIPEEINFRITEDEKELVLDYTGKAILENNEKYSVMIDAILMTAKSYGFESVRFDNIKIVRIGNYILEQPIKVPEGVNPYTIGK